MSIGLLILDGRTSKPEIDIDLVTKTHFFSTSGGLRTRGPSSAVPEAVSRETVVPVLA